MARLSELTVMLFSGNVTKYSTRCCSSLREQSGAEGRSSSSKVHRIKTAHSTQKLRSLAPHSNSAPNNRLGTLTLASGSESRLLNCDRNAVSLHSALLSFDSIASSSQCITPLQNKRVFSVRISGKEARLGSQHQ